MKQAHQHFIAALKKAEPATKGVMSGDSYIKSGHYYYGVAVPVRRQIIKQWLQNNHTVSTDECIALADSLFHGKSHEEKTMGAYLLLYVPAARELVAVQQIESWLSELVGWAEVDVLCQNLFQITDLLADWPAWEQLLVLLAQDENIQKRRASLVLLVGPTAKSNDARFHTMAFQNIEALKNEKEILITKAISWLLRSMIDTNKQAVAEYLATAGDSLPKIAIRETKTKLKTGKKNA